MGLESIIGIVVLVVILFVAFRIGAVLMRLALGLLAIGIVIWLIMGLLAGVAV
jgi:hypothetical protein